MLINSYFVHTHGACTLHSAHTRRVSNEQHITSNLNIIHTILFNFFPSYIHFFHLFCSTFVHFCIIFMFIFPFSHQATVAWNAMCECIFPFRTKNKRLLLVLGGKYTRSHTYIWIQQLKWGMHTKLCKICMALT